MVAVPVAAFVVFAIMRGIQTGGLFEDPAVKGEPA